MAIVQPTKTKIWPVLDFQDWTSHRYIDVFKAFVRVDVAAFDDCWFKISLLIALCGWGTAEAPAAKLQGQKVLSEWILQQNFSKWY